MIVAFLIYPERKAYSRKTRAPRSSFVKTGAHEPRKGKQPL